MGRRILAVLLDFGDTLANQETEQRDVSGFMYDVDLLDGARELLGVLRQRGYRVGLVADGRVDESRVLRARHDLDSLIDAVVISDEVGAAKPDRRPFDAALRRLGISPAQADRVVMVGNRLERDIRGASELGMVTVWINASARYRKFPRQPSEVPDHIIHEPLELLQVLDRLETEHAPGSDLLQTAGVTSNDDGRPRGDAPGRNLALELVRVTEAGALAAARFIGMGDKEAADEAAVDAMRLVLDTVPMTGVVVIGEGEKDEAPMLYNGEQIGDGGPPEVDIAVDPLEGTTLTAHGMPSALSVIAMAERGSMFDPGPCVYMEKIAGARDIADLLDLDRPLPETLRLVAQRREMDLRDITVVMLDRPRLKEATRQVREAGARVRLIADGDVAAALLAASEDSPVDVLWGIGGTPEGVISAAALKSAGGQLVGRLWPRNDEERDAAIDAGYDLDKQLTADDLIASDNCGFAATGVTDGDILEGVRYQKARGATTESLVMRSRSGTVRRIRATHDRDKLSAVTGQLDF